MTRRQILKLILAPVMVGLVAVAATYAYLQRLGPPPGEELRVVAAGRAMPAGTVLTAADLVLKVVPPSLAGPEVITDLGQAEGKATLAPLVPGELVLRSKLVQPGTTRALGGHLPPGLRALTVAADEVRAVGWLLQPGDRVDVIATFPKEVAGSDKARLLLEDIQVLAVGQATGVTSGSGKQSSGETRSVTLAVTPEQAVALALAEQTGRIRLALRPLTGEWTRGEIEINTGAFAAGASARLEPSPGPAFRGVAAVFEVRAEGLGTLGLGPGWAPGVAVRDVSVQAQFDALVKKGQARLVTRREMVGGSGVPLRWELQSSLPVSGQGGLAWMSYGFCLEVVGAPAENQAWRVDAAAELRYLDVPAQEAPVAEMAGGSSLEAGRVYPGTERLAATLTLDASRCALIHGLLGPQSLKPPEGFRRVGLPAALHSPEVENGTGEMLVLFSVVP